MNHETFTGGSVHVTNIIEHIQIIHLMTDFQHWQNPLYIASYIYIYISHGG